MTELLPPTTADGMRRLSHSTMKGLLDQCAYQVGLKRIMKEDDPGNVRTVAGTSYHGGIEAHEESRRLYRVTRGRKGSPDGVPFSVAFEASRLQLIDEAEKAGLTDEERHEAADQIEAGLHHWWDTPIPDGQLGAGASLRDRVMHWKPVAVETQWTLWLPEVTTLPTVGAADVVYQDEEGNLVVVDQKSASSFGKYKLDGEGLVDQAAMYGLAAMQAPSLPGYRGVIPRFEYHVTRIEPGKNSRFQGARLVPIDLDEIDIEYIQERLGQAHDVALEGEFPKNPDTWLCSEKWCPFFNNGCNPLGPNEVDFREEVASWDLV